MYTSKQIAKVFKILNKNKTNYWTGTECINFEKEFSKYHDVKYSVAVSNGSVALEIALKALNLKNNDTVIVSPRSFIISASCVINLGLKPIFADVDDNGNLSIEGIRKAYNKSVKAIIIVHLNGLACDMNPVLKFIKDKKVFLIEDCSQAHGAIYKGKKVGSFGHISTWSFCQDKIISTGGEGGMIATSQKNLFLKIWSLKDHGKNYKKVFYKKHKLGFRWLHDGIGSNYRMTEMQAAIGREQLKLLNKQIKKRKQIVNLYLDALRDYIEKYKIIKKPNFKCHSCSLKNSKKSCGDCTHAFYRLNLFINHNKIKQNDLLADLNDSNINCGVGPCPEIYREKVFKKLKIYPKKRLPNAKLLGKTSIMFSVNPHEPLSKKKNEANILKKILAKYV